MAHIEYVQDTICFNTQAIERTINDPAVRDELIAIVKKEHEFTKLRQEAADRRIDESDSDLPGLAKAMVNLNSQLQALGLLTPLIEKDEKADELFLETARGKYSNITNLEDEAIKLLSKGTKQKKERFEQTARNPKEPATERSLAYKILLLERFPTDRAAFELFSDLTRDTSIIDIYTRDGTVSPGAKHEYDMKVKFSKKPENVETLKEAVEHAQNEFRLGALDILKYVMENKGYRIFSDELERSRRSTELCTDIRTLIEEHPSHKVTTLCFFASQVKQTPDNDCNIYHTLKRIVGTLEVQSYQDLIIDTLCDLRTRMKTRER